MPVGVAPGGRRMGSGAGRGMKWLLSWFDVIGG